MCEKRKIAVNLDRISSGCQLTAAIISGRGVPVKMRLSLLRWTSEHN